MLTISGYTWAKRHRRDFAAVLTIEDPMTRHGLRFHRTPHPEHLVLEFVDLDRPPPPPFDCAPAYRLADLHDVTRALQFGRTHDHLLVHCQVGISRSPAIALGILTERLGSEPAAFAELMRIRPEAVPNQHVISLIDQLLGSDLSGCLDQWNRRSSWSTLRRLLCRRAYFFAGGIPLEPELAAINSLDCMKEPPWKSVKNLTIP